MLPAPESLHAAALSPTAPPGSHAAAVSLAAVIRALTLLVALAACRERAPTTRPEPQLSQQEAQLRALGYLTWSPDPAEGTGVTTHVRERVQPGYTLVTLPGSCTAQLLTLDGEVKHAWSHERCLRWSPVTLLDDGDILVAGIAKSAHLPPPPLDQRRYLLRMTWTGRVRWQQALPALLRGVVVTTDGSIALTLDDRHIDAVHPKTETRDNRVTTLSNAGTATGNMSLYDTTTAGGMTLRPGTLTDGRVELLRAGSIDVMRWPGLSGRHPMYQIGNLLVALDHQNAVIILDEHRVVWSWGQGILSRPLDANLLANGNILVLDGGRERGWSRALEVNPVAGEIVWSWGDGESRQLRTQHGGAVQRLTNGNTLITEADRGRAVEITRGGEIVWEYRVPILNRQGHRTTVASAHRYHSAFIDSLRKQ